MRNSLSLLNSSSVPVTLTASDKKGFSRHASGLEMAAVTIAALAFAARKKLENSRVGLWLKSYCWRLTGIKSGEGSAKKVLPKNPVTPKTSVAGRLKFLNEIQMLRRLPVGLADLDGAFFHAIQILVHFVLQAKCAAHILRVEIG